MSSKKKVLIIDDNLQTVEVLTMILEEKGFEVFPAYVGEIGLKKARELRPDIIILDVMLPGMNGYKVCEHLKGDDETSGIPVVMLTGKDSVEDFEKGMEKKADWYVVKPYNVDHLMKIFEKLLK